MSKISERERLVSAIIWAHGPMDSTEVLCRLVDDWGIHDTMQKGATKTCESLVHKGFASRQLTTSGWTFSITPAGEDLACKYLLKTADDSRAAGVA